MQSKARYTQKDNQAVFVLNFYLSLPSSSASIVTTDLPMSLSMQSTTQRDVYVCDLQSIMDRVRELDTVLGWSLRSFFEVAQWGMRESIKRTGYRIHIWFRSKTHDGFLVAVIAVVRPQSVRWQTHKYTAMTHGSIKRTNYRKCPKFEAKKEKSKDGV